MPDPTEAAFVKGEFFKQVKEALAKQKTTLQQFEAMTKDSRPQIRRCYRNNI